MNSLPSLTTDQVYKTRQRRGFTAIELLASITLAMMLMTAVLGILESMTRGQQKLLTKQPVELWKSRWQAQLEWDLENSRSLRQAPDGFYLDGFAGRNPIDGRPVHCRTSVRYAVQQCGKQNCLIREESNLDSLSLENATVEIVAIGIDRLVIGRSRSNGNFASDETEIVAEQGIADGPLPPQLVVALYGLGQSSPVYQGTFTSR